MYQVTITGIGKTGKIRRYFSSIGAARDYADRRVNDGVVTVKRIKVHDTSDDAR